MQSVHDLAAERAAGRGLKPKTVSEDKRLSRPADVYLNATYPPK